MNLQSGVSLGGQASMPEARPTPEVGQTLTLQFYPYGGLSEVYGDQYTKGGTYIEVEVKAVKTAKVVLE